VTDPSPPGRQSWAVTTLALLFDCDGVLVDSDTSVLRAWSRWSEHYGLDPLAVYPQVHGRRAADTVATLLPATAVAEAVERINRYELEDARSVNAMPGAVELTAELPAHRWAVVTSATSALAAARLAAAGITKPGVLITADDLRHGKPAPEGYLRAARELGQDPSACVVLEDAASGITAARAGGVATVVGIGARSLESDADVVIRDLGCATYDGVAGRLTIAGPRLR
jgi:mannitol-1-/sugar-/sorbitol-6-phosphatase